MKALVYEKFRGPIRVVDVVEPPVPSDGVVIRVSASGLCRSDRHAWAGHDDSVRLPHIPGHEFVGVIAAVGPEVTGWTEGARVTAPFVNGCGRCAWCRSGQAQVCPAQTQPGFTDPGSHAEYVAVRAADLNLVGLPGQVSDDAAASLGCRFATAFRALTTRAQVQPGEWVAVYGAGGVGLSAIQIAKALGARPIAVDRSAAALRLARTLGAEVTIASDDDVVGQIEAVTGGGADVTVDAVGAVDTVTNAILSLRRRGRHVQVGLLTQPLTSVPLGRAVAWELDILGSHGMAAADYPGMLDLVASGTLQPQDLIATTMDFAEAARRIPLERQPEPGIAILHPDLP